MSKEEEKKEMETNIVRRLVFPSGAIKSMNADDFVILDDELVKLKTKECMLILFYTENVESYQLAKIWSLVAQQTAGPTYGAVNMLNEQKIATVFTKLKSDGSNPLHWAGLRQYPFILVYRGGWPVAVYNGPRSVQALIDYSLTLACNAGYYETLQLGGSMEADNRLEMGPYQPYTDIPNEPPRVRKTSIDYNSSEPVRGFNPNLPETVPGSAVSKAATAQIRLDESRVQAEEKLGVSGSLTEIKEAEPSSSSSSAPFVPVPAE